MGGTQKHIRLKVCGMRELENIKQLAELNPEYMGLIFYDKSPRFMDRTLLASDLSFMPKSIFKVGVFVNEDIANVKTKVIEFNLDLVQLHGSEDVDYCRSCRENTMVIKAFPMNDGFEFDFLNQYEDNVDFFLFDTKTKSHGGSGKKFNWSILKHYHLNKPFFLSGGIGEDDLEEINSLELSALFAIDINSRVEIKPGLKDIKKVRLIQKKLNSDTLINYSKNESSS